MTIQEAIQSNKRFRRKSMTPNRWYFKQGDYLWYHQDQIGEVTESKGISELFYIEDILATDWEVEDTSLTLKKSQLQAALKNAYFNDHDGTFDSLIHEFFKVLNV